MPNLLKDKVAIVTGAGRGIGRAHAMALAGQGAKVAVNDPGVARDGTQADKSVVDLVVAEIQKASGTAVANYDTVATSEGAANIIKCALDKFGRLDILVNNAGILRDRMIFNMSLSVLFMPCTLALSTLVGVELIIPIMGVREVTF